MEGTSIGVVDLLLSAFSHPTVFAFFCFFGRVFFSCGDKRIRYDITSAGNGKGWSVHNVVSHLCNHVPCNKIIAFSASFSTSLLLLNYPLDMLSVQSPSPLNMSPTHSQYYNNAWAPWRSASDIQNDLPTPPSSVPPRRTKQQHAEHQLPLAQAHNEHHTHLTLPPITQLDRRSSWSSPRTCIHPPLCREPAVFTCAFVSQ